MLFEYPYYMNRYSRRTILLILVGLVLAGVGISVFASRSEHLYKFYYYPELNVYYDFKGQSFLYTLDGGETWLEKQPASRDLPEKLSKKVLIKAASREVWIDNELHRQKYSGVASDFLKERISKDPGFLDKEITTQNEMAPDSLQQINSIIHEVAIEEPADIHPPDTVSIKKVNTPELKPLPGDVPQDGPAEKTPHPEPSEPIIE